MRALIAVAAVLGALVLAAPSEAASFSKCGSVAVAGTKLPFAVKGAVTCKKAKAVLKGAGAGLCFDNQVPGWKRSRDGKFSYLRKGAKVIRFKGCGASLQLPSAGGGG